MPVVFPHHSATRSGAHGEPFFAASRSSHPVFTLGLPCSILARIADETPRYTRSGPNVQVIRPGQPSLDATQHTRNGVGTKDGIQLPEANPMVVASLSRSTAVPRNLCLFHPKTLIRYGKL